MHFSPSENAFFASEIKTAYVASGTWPDDAIEVTQEEWETYGEGMPPSGMQRGTDDDGRPAWVPVPPMPIEELADLKRAEIDSALSIELEKGMPRAMPDGTVEVVQTRPQDEPNLIRLAIEARDLRDQGITEPAQYIRVLSNRMYQLTPGQMIELTDAAAAFKKKLQDNSWRLKEAVEQARVNGDRKRLEAVAWE